MVLSDIIQILIEMDAEIGHLPLILERDLYLCNVKGHLVLTPDPVGTVIYVISTKSDRS